PGHRRGPGGGGGRHGPLRGASRRGHRLRPPRHLVVLRVHLPGSSSRWWTATVPVMKRRRCGLTVLLAAVLSVGGFALPAQSQEGGTPCRFEVDATLSPGLSRTPNSGTFTSGGETGTISCDGAVNGEQPA